MNDVWPVVHAERAALIADLEGLGNGGWSTPSLCEEWTVHDVVAHLVDTARTTRIGFVTGLVRARFDFDRQNERGIAACRETDPQDTLARFREVESLRSTPPAPLDSRLVEAIVHGEDIRRPLEIQRAYPADAVARALRLQAKTSASFGGAKEIAKRVTLAATDTDLTMGDGPTIEGPVLSLLLAMSGRHVAVDDLRGPGLEALETP